MRMGKRLIFISFLAMIGVIISIQMAAAAAYTVTTTGDHGYGPYQAGSGGEFTLTPNTDLYWVLSNYDSKALLYGNTAFQTFCLEKSETIAGNTTYSATLSNAAIRGGVGGSGTADPISIGSARLYYEFAKGKFTGLGSMPLYNYLATNATEVAARKASANALQQTIWWLEGEITDQPLNIFTSYILGAYTTEDERIAAVTAARADNSQFSLFPVMALNLSKEGDLYSQSQFVVTPIPASIWLIGTGLVGLAVIRRRFTT